ncbi:MAG: FeoB small GTPase domain-containing protein [Syntrophomonadaceae bacterium]|nr:FeoB small GTPase domain-containing protein [Syntrophomonadaceae bacterium]
MHVALVGNPNSGKSSVFNLLTGSNVFTSNYPGTSTEVVRTELKMGNRFVNIYDTPGIFSIFADNQEAETYRDLLQNLHLELLIHVIDASNLERHLVLTAELLELKYPLLIVINQIDRAREMGIHINAVELERLTSSPVVLLSSTSGEGMEDILDIIKKSLANKTISAGNEPGKAENSRLSCQGCTGDCHSCGIKVETTTTPADISRASWAKKTAELVSYRISPANKRRLAYVENLLNRPIFGTGVLLLLAYLGFWLLLHFIGWSETTVNMVLQPLSSSLENFITSILSPGLIATVLSRAVPEGLIIPFTIIMPAMLMVSLLMALLEDTGLLPRYTVALERVGSLVGVSGQAVIPLSLGFGCRTPAVLATRILPGEGQRFITITLLSIVIPCAATLGIMAMVVAHFHASLFVLVFSMLAVLLILGYILKHLIPLEESFIYELPPLRIPVAANLWHKIKIRFAGFFTEVLPLLLIMSIAVRALIESGLLEKVREIESFTQLVFGIPAEAFTAVLITIFQRYLAPLVLLNLNLSPREATIAITMVALSLPCLPVMVMTVREMGFKSLLKILAMGFATSFTIGIILNLLLPS